MSTKLLRVALFALVIAGCGKLPAGDNAGNGLRLVENERVTADQPFTLRIDRKVVVGRSPTWILSHSGILSRFRNDLYSLSSIDRSPAPHYWPIGSTISWNTVAIATPMETLVWPKGLGAGTYKLCNASPDDLCVKIVAE